MREIKIIILILLVFNFMNCKSQEIIGSKKEESKLLMSKIFSDFEKKNHNLIVDNKILNRLGVSDVDTWQQLVKKIHLILPMALTYNAKTKEDRIDYTKIFNQKEIDFMSQQAVKVNSETWSDYLGLRKDKIMMQPKLIFSHLKLTFSLHLYLQLTKITH